MNKQTILASLLLCGMVGIAQAHETDPRAPQSYVGAGFANFYGDEKDFGYEADDNGFKLLAGFEFSPYFAAELGYLDGATLVDVGRFDVEVVDLQALSGSLVGRLPITPTFSMFGKVGIARYQLDFQWLVDDVVDATARFTDNELIYGVGLSAHIGDSFEIRGEYEAIDHGFEAISINGVLRF